jgi:hypothetical protein
MSSLARALFAASLCLAVGPVIGQDSVADDVTFFEKHVRPLLASRCNQCHATDSDSVGGNLLLDSRSGWVAGGDLGPAIIPGDPDASLLLRAVKHSGDDLQMPPDGRLSDTEIRHLENWIRRGAVDPREGRATGRPATESIDWDTGRSHWAFQPLQKVRPPQLDRWWSRWAENEIDLIVAAQYAQRGLVPVARADRPTLIRRATFDLLGVPPTPEEVDRFVSDRLPGAYVRLIDRLLASPQYGERWGRHWLDVARYADSNGLDENAAHGNAWRYRDYVIGSFNRDLSYDLFVKEQLAGDQLASDNEDVRRQRIIATGFLVLGPKVLAEGDEKKMEMDIIDEQIETVGRAFLGLTLGCARCHDHKFDPIGTDDYYALVGIFGSTKTMEDYKRIAKWNEISVATAEQQRQRIEQQQRAAGAKKRLDEFIAKANRDLLASLAENAKLPKNPEQHYDQATQAQLVVWRAQLAESEAAIIELPAAMAVVDREHPTDQPVLIRGSHLTPADIVPRGFPTVLVSHREARRYAIPQHRSGRLELAEWLTDRDHPLVARVMVNRIWRWHFGRGITPSTDNLGLLGDRPSNPALLDWLAQTFIADGWSIKKLHRRIMLSATYRLSSTVSADNLRIDPENGAFWRFDVRRLEAEEILDSLHDVSGLLDRQMGGSMLETENRVLVFNHTSEDKTTYQSPRRAVYLPVIRNHLADVFQLFDYSEASVMTSDRPSTTVAPQALFLMNSDIAIRAAERFSQRLLEQSGLSDEALLTRAYQLAFGRSPSEQEISRDLQYLDLFMKSSRLEQQTTDLSEPDAAARRQAWQMLCHTLLAASEFCYVR